MNDQDFIAKLNKYPDLKSRFRELLNVVENSSNDLDRADDAEDRVTQELQKMGHELLTNWALNQEGKKYRESFSKKNQNCIQKKTLLAQQVWGHRALGENINRK